MRTKATWRDGIRLGFLILLAAFAYWVKAVTPNLPPPILTAIDAAIFFLALAMGWAVQDIVSRSEYNRSLRQYALSAYRRVTDISGTVTRIASETRRAILKQPESSPAVLHVIDALADELGSTVRSAIVDWAEVIGEDIRMLARYEQLRSRRKALSPEESPQDSSTAAQSIRRLEEEIAGLRRLLPTPMRTAIDLEEDILPRAGRLSRLVLERLLSEIRETSAVRILVSSASRLSEQVEMAIAAAAPYSFRIDTAARSEHLVIYDPRGDDIGVIVNPFQDLGIYEKDYHATLLEVLPILWNMGMGGMTTNHILQHSSYDGQGPQENMFYVMVFIPDDLRSELLAKGSAGTARDGRPIVGG